MRSEAERAFAPRAVAIVASYLGFYAIGLAIVAALLFLPYEQMRVGAFDLGGLAAGALAVVVAWALLPRFARKAHLGIPLDAERHARLHAFVAELASKVGQDAPARIYVVPYANAFAARERIGRSLFARPVVGIGLPLLLELDEKELASVVVHELGHHHAGDLLLGPFVHRTRRALADALDRLDGPGEFLRFPFTAYSRWFLRFSIPLGREQELHADDLARRTIGGRPTASALARSEEIGLRWGLFFASDLLPIVDRAFVPDVVAGYRTFVAGFDESEAKRSDEQRSAEKVVSEYDTHPPMDERIERVGGVGKYRTGDPAIDLVDDVDDLVLTAVRSILRDGVDLRPIAWADTPAKIWIPAFRRSVDSFPGLAAQVGLAGVPHYARSLDELAWSMRAGVQVTSPEAARRRARRWLLDHLTLALVDGGLALEVVPGKPTTVLSREGPIVPEKLLAELESGALDAAGFAALLERVGVPERARAR